MFGEFKKHGLRNRELANRYRHTVLAPGGSRPAADLVADFLGRPFNFDAFAEDMNSGLRP
jgi:thimet oligopeptidase